MIIYVIFIQRKAIIVRLEMIGENIYIIICWELRKILNQFFMNLKKTKRLV